MELFQGVSTIDFSVVTTDPKLATITKFFKLPAYISSHSYCLSPVSAPVACVLYRGQSDGSYVGSTWQSPRGEPTSDPDDSGPVLDPKASVPVSAEQVRDIDEVAGVSEEVLSVDRSEVEPVVERG